MAKQVQGNPRFNNNIDLTTYAFNSTGASGSLVFAAGVDASSLQRGDSVILGIDCGGYSGGYQDAQEYFVVSGSSGLVSITKSKERTSGDGYSGNTSGGAWELSGAAGSGTLYPNRRVGGTLFIGHGGNVYIRGIGHGSDSDEIVNGGPFVKHVVTSGSVLPFMIKDVSTSGTTATNLVRWYQ